MKNLEELVKALTEFTESNADVKSYFDIISKALLCDCTIVKGKKEYRIRVCAIGEHLVAAKLIEMGCLYGQPVH